MSTPESTAVSCEILYHGELKDNLWDHIGKTHKMEVTYSTTKLIYSGPYMTRESGEVGTQAQGIES